MEIISQTKDISETTVEHLRHDHQISNEIRIDVVVLLWGEGGVAVGGGHWILYFRLIKGIRFLSDMCLFLLAKLNWK